jgi:RNA-binding protein
MLTGKQRAALRKMANDIDTIFQVGKNGISDNLISQINDALEARELIKIRALDTAGEMPRQLCNMICEATGAEPVSVIGGRFTIYKPSKNNKRIKLS